jgi:ATP-dependent Clp protease ATP-binding subunit ClpC
VFNSLLQILEDGRLTDSQGRVVNSRTRSHHDHHLGTKDIAKGLLTGFQAGGELASDYQRMKAKSTRSSSSSSAEFLNRVDEVVVFPQLSRAEILQIVDLMIAKLAIRLKDRDMSIELPRRQGAARGPRVRPGARRPAVAPRHQRSIEDSLSEKILFGEIRSGQKVIVDAEGEGLLGEFTFRGVPRTT